MTTEGPGALPNGKFHGHDVEAWGSNPWPFVPAREHGLLETVGLAYGMHYPLVLTPDAIWLSIAQGFAIHVKENAERLRGKFVRHQGRAEIRVRRDDFVKGDPRNPWPEVFGAFSDGIAAHIGRQRDLVVCDFSTTGPFERAASEIVLMDAFQKYFKYVLETMCGIPEITLEGTPGDWRSIARRVRVLEEYELSWWTDALGPVIAQFVAAAEGRVDVPFWEALFKEDGGSGGPYVSGWINVFFPYLKYENEFSKNPAAVSWADGFGGARGAGAQRYMIPSGISIAPFRWEYLGSEFEMELAAGFFGIAQDEDTRALRPAIGWAVWDAGQEAKLERPDGMPESEPPPPPDPPGWSRLVALPGSLRRGDGATVIAGRTATRDEITLADIERMAGRVETLRKEVDARFVCIPVGDLSPASNAPEAPFRCRLFVGVCSGAVSLIQQWTQPIEDPAKILEAARALPAAAWQSLDEVAPGGLSEAMGVHLVVNGRSVRSVVVYGMQDPYYYTWLNWPLSEWGWGDVAAEAATAGNPCAVVDTSPEAHAQRVAAAKSLGVEDGAYYLAIEYR
jgi:hypothetical protein